MRSSKLLLRCPKASITARLYRSIDAGCRPYRSAEKAVNISGPSIASWVNLMDKVALAGMGEQQRFALSADSAPPR
ncbi:MAG: hypothetical protein ACLQBA_16465 [Candidatus Binataceae bacterium]